MMRQRRRKSSTMKPEDVAMPVLPGRCRSRAALAITVAMRCPRRGCMKEAARSGASACCPPRSASRARNGHMTPCWLFTNVTALKAIQEVCVVVSAGGAVRGAMAGRRCARVVKVARNVPAVPPPPPAALVCCRECRNGQKCVPRGVACAKVRSLLAPVLVRRTKMGEEGIRCEAATEEGCCVGS